MKKKLIVLCGALVVAVAAVSITVASRDVSPFSGMTKASVEALSQNEITGKESQGFQFENDIICYFYLSNGEVIKQIRQAMDCFPLIESACSLKRPC